MKQLNNNIPINGFATLLATILVLSVMIIIGLSISVLAMGQIRTIRDIIRSAQSYYVAEAGIEDSLLRLSKGMNFTKTNNLTVGDGSAAIQIGDPIGRSRTITSQGNVADRLRKVRVVWAMTTEEVSFNFGAQAGEGGIDMESNSVIHGNVFSNGTVQAITGTAYIDNSIIVANDGNMIKDLVVGTLGSSPPDEAKAYTCLDSTINGNLYYVAGGSSNCTVNGGSEDILPESVEPEDMPVSDDQISNWKNEAAGGGVEYGDYTVSGGDTESLGPKKIEGSLIIENNATLILTGILWVTANITIENGATIRLDSDFDSTSGVIVADEKILAKNGAVLEGSGGEGSYLMLLTTNNSLDPNDPAIYAKNNTQGAIFYASQGMIRLRNNINIREATGWKLYLDNNAEVTYESGLVSSLFSSGPGGSQEVVEWKEVE